MKQVGSDGKAKPGTWTLSTQEATKVRRMLSWYDDVMASVPKEHQGTMGGLLNSPLPGSPRRG